MKTIVPSAPRQLFEWLNTLQEIGPRNEVGVGNLGRIEKWGLKCFKEGYRACEKERAVQTRKQVSPKPVRR